MDTPSMVGAAAEREVACALHRAGWQVFDPLFDTCGRIDLIAIDPEDVVHRLQVKTSRIIRNGSVLCFRTCSNTGNVPRAYDGEIDDFGVWSPTLETVFLVPADAVPSRLCHLRLTSPANGQQRGVRFASRYAIAGPA